MDVAGRSTDWHQLSIGKARAEQIAPLATCRYISNRRGVGGQLHYLMQRPSYSPETSAYWADLDHLGAFHKWTPRVLYINLIGVIYLFVGFFVLFKQGGRAPFVLHFATFCLAAFVFLFYTPVGSYRDLDLAIAFLDNAALIFFPPLFLHFCALYPSRQQLFATRRWRAVLLYVPALLLLAFSVSCSCAMKWRRRFPPSRIPVSEQLVGFFYWLNIAALRQSRSIASARAVAANFRQGKEHDRSTAGEVGGVGNGARDHSFHTSLRRCLPVWRADRSLAD